MCIYEVAELPVFATKTVYVDEPFLYSILYPSMAEPPLFCGGFQDNLILVVEAVLATRPMGELGTEDITVGAVDAVFDDVLIPA